MSTASARAITAIAGTRRVVQLYPPTHPVYKEALLELEGAIRAAASVAPLVLNLHQGHLYEDSSVLPDDIPGLNQVAEVLEALQLESVAFQPSFSASDAVALTEILALRPSPDLNVSAELAARGVDSVAVSLLAREGSDEGAAADPASKRNRRVHQNSVSAVREVFRGVLSDDLMAVEKARDVALSIMTRLETDMAFVLAMATASEPDERHIFHALDVMIYSLVLGNRLSLPPDGMASLGSAALLHDVGQLAFNPNDPEEVERSKTEHTAVGAEMLAKHARVDVAPMLVAYEHHMYPDGSGFPIREESYVTHPYSRMVAIADWFDCLINPTNGTAPLTPDRALVQLLRIASKKLDPFFVRMFAGALGPFPIGCVVRLSDQSVGVVAHPGEVPLTPTVRLAYDPLGLEVTSRAEVIDLGGVDLRIVEVLTPGSLHMDVAERLL